MIHIYTGLGRRTRKPVTLYVGTNRVVKSVDKLYLGYDNTAKEVDLGAEPSIGEIRFFDSDTATYADSYGTWIKTGTSITQEEYPQLIGLSGVETESPGNIIDPSYSVSYSGNDSRGTAKGAIDGNLNTFWLNTGSTGWYTVILPTAQKITAYSLACLQPVGQSWGMNERATSWQLQGSNNNSTWTTLHSVSNFNPGTYYDETYSVSTTTAYKYYRINITQTVGGWCYISEFRLFGEPSYRITPVADNTKGQTAYMFAVPV